MQIDGCVLLLDVDSTYSQSAEKRINGWCESLTATVIHASIKMSPCICRELRSVSSDECYVIASQAIFARHQGTYR